MVPVAPRGGHGAGRLRREHAGGRGEVGRGGDHRVGVDGGRGGALVGGRRQRGVPAVANRRSRRPPERRIRSVTAGRPTSGRCSRRSGLFVAGAAVSVTHGIQELITPEPAGHFVVGYVVLAVSFVLEGISFLQSVRQAKPEAESMQRDLIEHVLATSDPTLRAVFAEDAAALAGLVIAAAGLAAHQLTGSAMPDAIGSILIGVLLAVRRAAADQPQPAVPRRAGGRSAGARGDPAGDARRAGGRPGHLAPAGDRRPADDLGDRRRRPHRRRQRVARRGPAAGAGGQDQRLPRRRRRGTEPLGARRADPHGLKRTRPRLLSRAGGCRGAVIIGGTMAP